MNENGSITLEGIDNVIGALTKLEPRAVEKATQAIEKSGLEIIADAQNNLRSNSSVVTGLLRQSGKVQQCDDGTIEIGFFDTQNEGKGYAWYVEKGRRSGKMPPPWALIEYAHKKLRLAVKEAAAAGWAMARKIAKEGTTPHPFFEPAVQKNKSKMIEEVQKALSNL